LNRTDKVATGSYFENMAEIKTVGVKELKNNLSAYLREIRRGTRILVSDRSTVVAELHEPGATYPAPGKGDPVISGWVEAGIVALPAGPKESLRTLGALHLASALEFTQAFPELRILGFDRRILENAEALGLG